MPRTTADTRTEIRSAALDLFAERGVDSTSLREIAARIGITKAALYYHYASKDALLADLVEPLFTELTMLGDHIRTIGGVDTADAAAVREILERFWSLCRRQRQVMRVLLHNAAVVHRDGLALRVLQWRERIDTALVGSDRAVDRVRAIVALGGIQDAAMVYGDGDDQAAVHAAVIEAALRALRP